MEEERVERNLAKDLDYINNEIIAKQTDGNYCKYSRILNAVAIIGLTTDQYEKYWSNRYKGSPDEYEQIHQAITDKFNVGLISQDEMIDLIQKSKDVPNEKKKAISLLRRVTDGN